MYNWEQYFASLVLNYSRLEILSIRLSSYIKLVTTSFSVFGHRTSVFITILAFVLLGNHITADKAFILVIMYAILHEPVIYYFPKGFFALMGSFVALKRLNAFLLCDETQGKFHYSLKAISNAIVLQNVTVQKKGTILDDVSFNIKRGSLIAIVGPVGCGKTSLVHVIMNEQNANSGSCEVSGSVSYASQESWIFTSNVKQNIIFNSKLEERRYSKVLDVCALKHDLKSLPHGDLTIVGDRGSSLSGGQRARINLARAVYRDADIYILDDPLSAVDSRVGQSIFDKCIKSFLKDKTVLLITHQVQYLHAVDEIIVLNNGKVITKGPSSELISQNVNFKEILHQSKEKAGTEYDQNLLIETLDTKSLTLTEKDFPQQEEEHVARADVSTSVYKAYFTSGNNSILLFVSLVLVIITQIFISGTDYFITYWVNTEQLRSQSESDSEPFIAVSVKISIYAYSCLVFGMVIFCLITISAMHNICMRSSIQLHKTMFNCVMGAPLKFFHLNHSGRILNRFSKDKEIIDELLPIYINNTLLFGVGIVSVVVLMAFVNYLYLLPAFVAIVALYYLRNIYIPTSKTLKHLEATTTSSVLGYINATVQGLTTIRAFDAQQMVLHEFTSHQNLNSSTFYMFIATTRAFTYWTDTICNIILICSMVINLISNETLGGNIGLSISQSLGLVGYLHFVVRSYAEMENGMTSVERVLEYSKLEQEQDDNKVILESVSPYWPVYGGILFNNVSLSYSPQGPLVLKSINVVIQSRERIGVVGRTGAGKSSLVNALFRLSEFSGSITIDGLDTKMLRLHDLRTKLSIIPQQPTIFSGSFRSNLDPFCQYSDATLWDALDIVKLKNVVSDLPSGLDFEITKNGLNFSVGQRQLICLARAILKNNKILVLDEATSNVDPQTDLLIQQTVRKNCSNCTVITIAHRLDTVIDYDKILVLEDGVVVEFDHPYILLQDSNGKFRYMVDSLTKSSSETIEMIARMNYDKSMQNSKL